MNSYLVDKNGVKMRYIGGGSIKGSGSNIILDFNFRPNDATFHAIYDAMFR